MSETLDIEPLASPPLSEPWVPLWPLAPARLGELAYAQITASVTVTATAEASAVTVVTAPAYTFDGSTPVVIEFFCPSINTPAVAGGDTRLGLWDGETNLGNLGTVQTPAAATTRVPIRTAIRLTPSAGAHTFSIRAYTTSGSATGVVTAGPGGAGQWPPAFIRVSLAAPLLSAPPGAAVAVQYGTSLPTSPLDGQEAILVDSLTNPTYQWRFRYNAGSTSAYKWEFVGGSPLVSELLASRTTTAGAFTEIGLPSAVIPRTGDYVLALGAQIIGQGAIAPHGAGSTAADDYAAMSATPTGNANAWAQFRRALTATGTLWVYGKSFSGTVEFLRTRLVIIPIRVS